MEAKNLTNKKEKLRTSSQLKTFKGQRHTYCLSKKSDPFFIVTYSIRLANTFWTSSSYVVEIISCSSLELVMLLGMFILKNIHRAETNVLSVQEVLTHFIVTTYEKWVKASWTCSSRTNFLLQVWNLLCFQECSPVSAVSPLRLLIAPRQGGIHIHCRK